MITYDQGTRCVICVKNALVQKDMSTDKPVLDAVDGASTAVVVFEGNGLCAHHLHARLTEDSLEAYLAEIERQNSGRRS